MSLLQGQQSQRLLFQYWQGLLSLICDSLESMLLNYPKKTNND